MKAELRRRGMKAYELPWGLVIDKSPTRMNSPNNCDVRSTRFWNVSKDSSTGYPMVRRRTVYMGKASRRKSENRELKRTNPGQFAQSHGKTGYRAALTRRLQILRSQWQWHANWPRSLMRQSAPGTSTLR